MYRNRTMIVDCASYLHSEAWSIGFPCTVLFHLSSMQSTIARHGFQTKRQNMTEKIRKRTLLTSTGSIPMCNPHLLSRCGQSAGQQHTGLFVFSFTAAQVPWLPSALPTQTPSVTATILESWFLAVGKLLRVYAFYAMNGHVEFVSIVWNYRLRNMDSRR